MGGYGGYGMGMSLAREAMIPLAGNPQGVQQGMAGAVSLASLLQNQNQQRQMFPVELQQQQQRAQMGALAVQQATQQAQDEAQFKQSLMDNNGDWGKAIQSVSGKVSPAYQQAVLATHEKYLAAAAAMSKEQREQAKSVNDQATTLTNNAVGLPDDQLMNGGYQSYAQQLSALDPNAAKMLPTGAGMTAQQLRDAIKSGVGLRYAVAKKILTIPAGATVGEQQPGGEVKPLYTAPNKPTNENVTQMEMDDWLKKHPGKGPADFMAYQKTLVPSFNFNLQNQTSNAPLNPKQEATVQALLEGRMSQPSSFALKTPYWQNIMGEVFRRDPQWSEQRAQVRKAFATGADGKNIGALNTATVHLDTLADMASALGNKDVRGINAVINRAKTELGYSPPTNFEGVRSAVAGEMASALKGNATDQEIANIDKDIRSKNSPQQLHDYINTQMHILDQKLTTYDQRYHQYMPGDTAWSPILPQAQAILAKHGVTAQPQNQAAAPMFSVGQAVTIKGKSMKVTAVHPDGSFDAQ